MYCLTTMTFLNWTKQGLNNPRISCKQWVFMWLCRQAGLVVITNTISDVSVLIYFEEILKASATLKNPWILTVQMFWHSTLTLQLVPLGLNRHPGAPVTERHSLVKACPWPEWQPQTKTHKCVTREKKATHGERTPCCPHAH